MSFLFRFIVSDALVIQTNYRNIDKSSQPSKYCHAHESQPKFQTEARYAPNSCLHDAVLSATICATRLHWLPFYTTFYSDFETCTTFAFITSNIVLVKTVTAQGQHFEGHLLNYVYNFIFFKFIYVWYSVNDINMTWLIPNFISMVKLWRTCVVKYFIYLIPDRD